MLCIGAFKVGVFLAFAWFTLSLNLIFVQFRSIWDWMIWFWSKLAVLEGQMKYDMKKAVLLASAHNTIVVGLLKYSLFFFSFILRGGTQDMQYWNSACAVIPVREDL